MVFEGLEKDMYDKEEVPVMNHWSYGLEKKILLHPHVHVLPDTCG